MAGMEIAVKPGPTAISKRSSDLERQDAIEAELVILAEARQSSVSAAALQVYSLDLLTADWRDFQAAMKELRHRERRDGELTFPALATVNAVVRRHRVKRQESERQERDSREYAEWRKKRAENPAEYPTFDEMIVEAAAKLGIKRGIELAAKKVEGIPATCPHCDGKLPFGNHIRLWEPEQLREVASFIERRREYQAERQKLMDESVQAVIASGGQG